MEGVRLAWKVIQSELMAKSYQRIASLTEDIVSSDEKLKLNIRANIGTYCHAPGTGSGP
jgi:hypothetical protein